LADPSGGSETACGGRCEAARTLQGCIDRCCEVVFRRGCAFLPLPEALREGEGDGEAKGEGGQRDSGSRPLALPHVPESLPGVLAHWLGELRRFACQEDLAARLAAVLSERQPPRGAVAQPCPPDAKSQQLVAAVKQLVQREADAADLLDEARLLDADSRGGEEEGSLPGKLPLLLILRFQRLFDCPALEQVLTAMNKVYMETQEARNMRRHLAGLLRLESSASAERCVAAVRHLVLGEALGGDDAGLQDDYR